MHVERLAPAGQLQQPYHRPGPGPPAARRGRLAGLTIGTAQSLLTDIDHGSVSQVRLKLANIRGFAALAC
jgi:hypothetical protein